MSDRNKITCTVLIPAYNAEKYIAKAISSILAQTFKDFELLIINDGSTDKTAEIILKFNDPRIRLITHQRNLGLIETLNEGVKKACGKYIIRMDADDESLSPRLQIQIEFMETHPKIGVCGSWIKIIGDQSIIKYPTDPEEIRGKLFFGSPLAHPSVIMKTELFQNENLVYDKRFPHAEDYELWTRVIHFADIANIPKVLLLYRRHEAQVSLIHRETQIKSTLQASLNTLSSIGINPENDTEKIIHQFVTSGYFLNKDSVDLKDVESWLRKLKEKVGNKIIMQIWIEACLSQSYKGITTWKTFIKSSISTSLAFRYKLLFKLKSLKLLIKSLLKK